jgi:beta-N-acetylhexosaminidase
MTLDTIITTQDDFTQAPFNLDAAALAWIEDRMAALSPRQKLGQLFNVLMPKDDPALLARIRDLAPGCIARLQMNSPEEEQALIAGFNAANPVPLMVSTDLEGSFSAPPGTHYAPNPLSFAAIDDPALTAEATRMMAAEAAAFGINWSYTPSMDINAAFRSAITSTRSFGSDLRRIREQALAHLGALQEVGFAATAKHWPGEGYDDRDQHLVTTINPLSVPEWEATYGALYRAAIDAGVLSIMSAHIAFPAFMREIGATGDDLLRPATINAALNEDLLRGRLGFRGLIVSDATAMAGITSWLSRADLVVEVLNAGCDVILYSPDLKADIDTLERACAEGRVSWARVDQAVRRQLAMKARLGLHRDPAHLSRDLPKTRRPAADAALSADLLARIPTLVKDHTGLLPLSPSRTRKILLVSRGVVLPFVPHPLPLALPDMLRAEGFEVTLHEWGTPVVAEGHDLVLYAFAEETLLTRGNINLNWLEMNGDFEAALVRPWTTTPCLMISFGWPYYLYEAPRVPAYINAYSSHPLMQKAVVAALMGRSAFQGSSPVDPFAGNPAQ